MDPFYKSVNSLSSGFNIPDTSTCNLFIDLFEADKNRLYAYIYAYMLDYAATDDIFQETSMTLWRDFSQFEQGSHFSKWANGIAFNRVLTYKTKQKKYTLGLSEDFLYEFRDSLSIIEDSLIASELKWLYLEQCCDALSLPLKQVYHHFYVKNFTAKEIAEETGRSVHAIRKVVHKLRKKLFDCVQSKVKKDSK